MRSKIIIFISVVAVLIALFVWFGPKQRVEFKSVRAEIPVGWQAEVIETGDEFEILMRPRTSMLGLGVVKVRYHSCGEVANTENLLHALNKDILEQDYKAEQVNDRTWVRNEAQVEGVAIYQAKTVLKKGWCLGVTGDPRKKFDDVLKSVFILN